ncbi:cytochrome P450 [Croceicoccus mobilis]|uniref:Cytochrome P450 n=1 Tax=Croceicoccus mobilis TaxID=1703339 RepID=A0A917DXV4_9SPHN|nr:cytochrome P450 [Croceicoccus mobilis]GGD80561.1 cytochrome P450 [Croceicoccus mobilis]
MLEDEIGTGGTLDMTQVMEGGCPYAKYAEMHARGGVWRDENSGFYIVTDYADVRRIAGDNKRFSNRTGLLVERDTPLRDEIDRMYREEAWLQIHTLVTNDPPSHRRFRSLVERLFTAQRVEAMESYIQGLVDELIEAVLPAGRMEVSSQLSGVFPAIIAGDFLGLPRSDHARLKEYTDASNALTEPGFDEANELEMNRKVIQLLNYILERANISSAAEDGTFMHHVRTFEVDGRRLTDQELVWFVQPLFVGGHDSITLLIPTGVLRIIETQGLEEKLRAHPGMIPNFVEELMRHDAPVQCLWRRALEDVEVAGVTIHEGATIQLQWAAGNRDPARFDDPDMFDPERSNARQHLAFGHGPHLCIGNQLARAEMRIAFETMLRRTKNWRLDGDDAVEMRRHYMQWGASRLNIAFDAV